MTRIKAKKQSKFMQCIKAPIRVLSKAWRDFYMKILCDCAGKSSSRSTVCPAPPVISSSKEINSEEDHREVVRVVSKRHTAERSKAVMSIDQRQKGEQAAAMGANGVVGRSYSVGVGRIGRIDEDKPCEFEEEEEDVEANTSAHLMCPRTRSYVVTRRKIVHNH